MSERDPVPGISRDPEERAALSRDFGGTVRRMPGAVVTPESVEDVSRIVRWAARARVRLAIRGAGHSQGGQSLTEGGVVLDTRRLDRVRLFQEGQDLVRAQGGAAWTRVVDSLHGTGRLPCVLANFGELTVGGTLSAGGVGNSCHRYGAQIGSVEQLEVVTGTGERVLCSRDRNAGLFDAVRGGQGEFGIITEAWIRLRRAGSRYRQYEFRYRDFDRFSSDFERLVDEDRFGHLRAEIRIHDRRIILHAGAEYDDAIDNERMVEGLGYDTMAILWETTVVGHANMLPRGIGRWTNYHPWRDWFLPWKTLRTVLDQPWLDPDWVPRWPRSWTGIYPMINANSIEAPLFMRPGGERMLGYAVLPVLDDVGKARELAGRLREVSRELVDLGGKSYLSGEVGYGPEEWAEHYGEMLETGVGWKKAFDPHRVFGSDCMPFGGTEA